MAEKNRYPVRGMNNASYVYGSAVRAPEIPVIPEGKPEVRRRRDAEVIREAHREVEERVREKSALERSFSAGQVLILAVAAMVVILTAAFYIVELSGFLSAKNQVAAMEKEINTLTAENVLLENARESELDLESVYEFATVRGMRLPEKQQVITYQRVGREYVTKDGEIPDE